MNAVRAAVQKALETRKRNAEAKARIAAEQTKVRSIVMLGVCPCCHGPVRRNLALKGWYQCEQFGAEGFRVDASKPSCPWQGFAE